MKKFLPLVALLVTASFAAPVFAADAAPAPATKKEMHHDKKMAKKHKAIKHAKHKRDAAMKNGDTATAQHYQHKIDRMSAAPATEAAPTKVWMPSMQHGFQH